MKKRAFCLILIALCVLMSFVGCTNKDLDVKSTTEDNSFTSDKDTISNYTNEDYDFIYKSYWYNVIKEDNITLVCCSKFNSDFTINVTTYTFDENGNCKTDDYKYDFGFDENNTIVIGESRAWFYINTEKHCIEEKDKSNGDVIQTFIEEENNSLEIAKSLL